MKTTTQPTKHQIIDALRRFVAQRPGLDYCNYGDPTSYRSESRRITRQGKDANALLTSVELSDITAAELLDAFSAFSGRLSCEFDGEKVTLDYCTGQYWPTEYRAAVAAVCANALWNYHRPDAKAEAESKGISAGDAIRAKFRRMYGRRMQSRYFD